MYDRSLVNCVNNIAQINNDCVPMNMTTPEGKKHDIPMSKFRLTLSWLCWCPYSPQVPTFREDTEVLPRTRPAPPLVPSPGLTPSPRAPGPLAPGLPAPPDLGPPGLRSPRPVWVNQYNFSSLAECNVMGFRKVSNLDLKNMRLFGKSPLTSLTFL